MNYVIGIGLSAVVAAFGRWSGFDRDRGFYPTILIVVALYYVLFAVMGGSTQALIIESIIMLAFAGLAVAGFKRSLWIAAAALAAHGIMDLFHGHLVTNPGVPEWWPGFCLGYDVGAGLWLAFIIRADGRALGEAR